MGKKQSAKAKYWATYYASHVEQERLRKREWYLKNRERVIARNAHKQREKDQSTPTYRVGIKRRYIIVANRAYFNSRLGFSASELRAIANEISTAP